MGGNDLLTIEKPGISDRANGFDAGERGLPHELFHALRSIPYGSIVLTIHDGRIAEIQKIERIRRGGSRAESPERSASSK
jgi:hypothetical protein